MSLLFMIGIVATVVAAFFAYSAFKAGAANVILKITGGRRVQASKKAKEKTKKKSKRKSKKGADAAAAAALAEQQQSPEWAKYAELHKDSESPDHRPEEDHDGNLLIRPELQHVPETSAPAADQASFLGYEDAAQQAPEKRNE
jgi:hypothetical protein